MFEKDAWVEGMELGHLQKGDPRTVGWSPVCILGAAGGSYCENDWLSRLGAHRRHLAEGQEPGGLPSMEMMTSRWRSLFREMYELADSSSTVSLGSSLFFF
jgi:hypothetical protein